MPEGHTIHRLAGRLTSEFAGHVTRSSSPQGRFDMGAGAIDGRVLEVADAWGKHLFVRFEGLADEVHVHLGLFGRTRFAHDDVREVKGALRWRLEDDHTYFDLRGATACALMGPDEVGALVDRLGPDPLREESDPDQAWQRIRRSRAPIGGLLMDQKIVAGIGNVYRAEVLFRRGIDPFMEGRLLHRPEWLDMWSDLVVMMHEGVRTGRIDCIDTASRPASMGKAHALPHQPPGRVWVYRRQGEPCFVCGTPVRTEEMAARNLFWCPTCQRRTRRRAPGTGTRIT
ncbi:MAG: zinc finger domain-containing protein [Nocardioidaceae bacterium]|nr:zinc finger domain-containing protein [Nocardioidaceae bacterium]